MLLVLSYGVPSEANYTKSIEVPTLDCESKREKDANKEPVFDVPVLFAVISDCTHTLQEKQFAKLGEGCREPSIANPVFVGRDDKCIEPLNLKKGIRRRHVLTR